MERHVSCSGCLACPSLLATLRAISFSFRRQPQLRLWPKRRPPPVRTTGVPQSQTQRHAATVFLFSTLSTTSSLPKRWPTMSIILRAMAITNKLTDAVVRKALPGDRAYKLFDGNSLYLFISPKGAKVWRMAYRLDGKPQTATFGAYPLVTLAEARGKRDDLRKKLLDGVSPKARTRHGVAWKAAVEAYWDGRKDVSDSYRSNALRALEMHLKALDAKPVGTIAKADLLAELNKMDAAGLHVYVRKVRMWAGQVFDWAVEHGQAEVNPAAQIDPEKAFGRAKVKSHAAIGLADVPALLARLSLERELQSVLACRLMALTWTRTQELRFMEWGEIEGDTWRIPEGKMKRRFEHLVPLSRQALALLGKLKARDRGSKYVFPAEHRLDRPMSENAVLYLLHRIGYKGEMTGHGWRSVASTWANERGYNADAIERQLAHAPDDKVRAAYNRAAYLPERRQILQAWADWLDDADAGRVKG
jgi:integrase